MVSLYCGAVNQIVAIFNHDQLQNMFLWSSGSLNQMDWSRVAFLWPYLLCGLLLTLLLLRPMTLMGLDDGVAKNLGLAISLARIATLALAIVLSAALVNAAGIIGFVGLFSPLLARMLGFRRLFGRLMAAPLIGALLLWLADQSVLWLTGRIGEISTGTVTAVIGAPLLLWLLPRLRSAAQPPALDLGDKVPDERQRVLWWALLGGGILLLLIAAALSVTQRRRLGMGQRRTVAAAAAVAGATAGGGAGNRHDAGRGGLRGTAFDRQPDGQPGSAGDQLRGGLWRGHHAVYRPR